eukprot:3105088-Amphidinium_carterae.2
MQALPAAELYQPSRLFGLSEPAPGYSVVPKCPIANCCLVVTLAGGGGARGTNACGQASATTQ